MSSVTEATPLNNGQSGCGLSLSAHVHGHCERTCIDCVRTVLPLIKATLIIIKLLLKSVALNRGTTVVYIIYS